MEKENFSSSLIYKTKVTKGNKDVYINICLNDECKNGHQDFAITADVYEKDKPKLDKYCLGMGCMHEDIISAAPQFKMFVDLHLCDYKGIPMHAAANGFYHLTEGFNSTKPEQKGFKEEFCQYYRITPKQFDILKTTRNTIQYALKLKELNVLHQWQLEAVKAIKYLEELTGKTFVIDSKRTQFDEPTKEEVQKELKKQKEGYYTPEAEAKREAAARAKEFQDLEDEFEKEVAKHKLELEVKKEILRAGGTKALNNSIFYNHTKEIAFNWRGYDNLTSEFIEEVKSKLKLPKGITIKVEKK